MPALTPQITLTANLETILAGAAEAGYLRITLCGYGPVCPAVPGTAMLADSGVPQYVGPQVGSTPLSVTLFGNDVITPAGTFYEIAVLDYRKNVIEAQIYQFTGTQTIDLSSAAPVTGPYGFLIGDLAYRQCSGAVPGSAYVAPGKVVAVAYNGVLMPEGVALPVLSYTVGSDGVTITLNFATEAGDRIDAFCIL